MASEHLLRIVRSDSPGDHILLHTSSAGSSPLDLKLLATEGTQPYLKTLNASRISKYRAKSNHLTDPQWELLLRRTFLQEPPSPQDENSSAGNEDDPSKDLQLIASITPESLTLTLRKSISGIHQKLADFILPASPDTSIEVLDWCHTAIIRADTLSTQTISLQQQLDENTKTAAKLRSQLEELILAKKEHEEQLLRKCTVLIDEKKAKIRDQQRLLVKASVPQEAVEEVVRARHGGARSGSAAAATKARQPKPSGKGKRKADSHESSSDDFEDTKDVKTEAIEEEQHPDSEDITPQRSDLDETADEASDEEEVSAPTTAKGKVVESAGLMDGGKEKEGAVPKIGQLPPKRDLPFQNKEKLSQGQESGDGDTKMADNNVDDDETDDEL
ncbi:MAG: hypothetical protein Q9174_002845 [Haloplaca sp. 1 TL-2023]